MSWLFHRYRTYSTSCLSTLLVAIVPDEDVQTVHGECALTSCFWWNCLAQPDGDHNIPQMIQNRNIMHNLHLVSIRMARAVKEKLFLSEKKEKSFGIWLLGLDLCPESFQTRPPHPIQIAVVWKSGAVLETRI